MTRSILYQIKNNLAPNALTLLEFRALSSKLAVAKLSVLKISAHGILTRYYQSFIPDYIDT